MNTINIAQYQIAHDIAELAWAKILENTGLSLTDNQRAEIESAAIDVIQDVIEGEYNDQ